MPFSTPGDLPNPGIESKSPALAGVFFTTTPFRYDLNQIPYDYTVEVRNTFMGLDLIDCLMNYGRRFVTVYRRQGSRPSPWKTNAKKAKWLSEETLKIAAKKRSKKQRTKGKI